MGGYYGMEVLLGVAVLLTSVQCDLSCRGTDGQSGENGVAGRNGRPGAKGEKGEAAVRISFPVDPDVLLSLKGDTGSKGKQGTMGPKGFPGEVGPVGPKGKPGSRGPDGTRASGQQSVDQVHSAFSVMRTDRSYPAIGQVVTYQNTLVNVPGDFDARTGKFTCGVAGVHYFTFQSVARVSVCLRIARDPPLDQLGFCDTNRNIDQVHWSASYFQYFATSHSVLTGGVVLQLEAGQKVWLESSPGQQRLAETRDTQEKQIFFSGFRLF